MTSFAETESTTSADSVTPAETSMAVSRSSSMVLGDCTLFCEAFLKGLIGLPVSDVGLSGELSIFGTAEAASTGSVGSVVG